jgi:hypothetical protein
MSEVPGFTDTGIPLISSSIIFMGFSKIILF